MGLTDVSGEAWGTQSRGAPGAEGVDPLRGACSQPERSPGGELCFLLQAMKSRGKQWEGAETTLLAGIVGSWPSAALILGALGLLQLVAHSRPPFMSGTRSEDAGTSPILSVGSTPPLRRGGLAWGRVHAGGSGPEADRQTDRRDVLRAWPAHRPPPPQTFGKIGCPSCLLAFSGKFHAAGF